MTSFFVNTAMIAGDKTGGQLVVSGDFGDK